MRETGRLWNRLKQVSEAALLSGALRPLPTQYEVMEDRGIPFIVRVLASLEDKRQARRAQESAGASGDGGINPFLPYDKDLFVADLSNTHLCLLNKFNVLEHHLLIVTRAFEHQETLLTLEDFQALWTCLLEYDGLGFYNGGVAAGASQAHKHLQVVPLPMTDRGPRVPVEPLLASTVFRGETGVTPGLPWVHVWVRLPGLGGAGPEEAARASLEGYTAMLKAVGLGPGTGAGGRRQKGPYNLLITREWMFLAPRSREQFETVSVNALGFAGALLVKNVHEMHQVKDRGPVEVLRTVGVPTAGC